MIERMYAEYAWEKTQTLLSIDSPSGYTAKAAAWVRDAFAALGFDAKITVKGGVIFKFFNKVNCRYHLRYLLFVLKNFINKGNKLFFGDTDTLSL